MAIVYNTIEYSGARFEAVAEVLEIFGDSRRSKAQR